MARARITSGPRSRTPSKDVRRDLVAAAEVVLVRDGPGGLTVRAVAAQAGIAPMGVYNRLGGKDGLVDALLIKGFDLLRAAIAGGSESGRVDGLQAAGLRYREFALANRHFYGIMFEAAIPHQASSAEVTEHAAAAFGALAGIVGVAVAAGRIVAADPTAVAHQVWATAHGALALELHGLVLTPDPAATYRATLQTMLRGLARAEYAAVRAGQSAAR